MSAPPPASPSRFSLWLNPEGVFVLIAAAVTAVVASMPIIVLPGVLAYGILTYLRYGRAQAAEAAKAASPFAPDLSHLAPAYATRVARAVALQQAIFEQLESADAEHRALLAGTTDKIRPLVEAAAKLAQKLQDLDRHLAATSPGDLARETRDLERRIREAHDPTAREGFERALEQHKTKTAVFEELAARRERLDAQLLNVEKSLDTVRTQLLRIQSADTAASGAERLRIGETLDALSVDVEAVAETVDDAPIALKRMERGPAGRP